jgi:thiosulfate dehydrogenase
VKKFILGVIIGLLIPAVVVYCYIRFGFAPIATSAPPMPLEQKAANMIMRAHMQKEMPTNVPVPPTEDNLTQGANIYSANCAFCHGVPDQPPTMAAKGMFPLPPQLFSKDEMVTDDPVGRTFWTAKNGLRMTGMPGFGEMLSENQLWQVSLLLSQADKLPAGAKAALTKPQPTASQAQGVTPAVAPKPGQEHKHDHDHAHDN